jgi:DNA invertase Pin-like site-specific DNA recombinase
MHKQTDGKTTALYCRVAVKTTAGENLDNQMQELLCHAREQGLDSFVFYVDNGASGSTFKRPAMNLLKQDIEAGRVGLVLVTEISRLGRSVVSLSGFVKWARAHGTQIDCTSHGMTESGTDCFAGSLTLIQGGVEA